MRPDGSRCGAPLDAKGQHATSCKVGGWVVKRHDRLGRVAGEFAREQGAEVDYEVVVPTASDSQVASRLDIVVRPPAGITGIVPPRQFCDVSVASCWSLEAMRRGRAARSEGTAALLAENAKKLEYSRLADHGLAPLTCEVHGRMGPHLLAWARSLAPAPAEGRGQVLGGFFQDWGCSLQQSIAAAILAAAALPRS